MRAAGSGVLALIVAGLVTTGAPASPRAEAATAPPVELTVAPLHAGVVAAGGDLRVEVELHDTGAAAIPAGRVDLALDSTAPAGVAALTSRLAHPSFTEPGSILVGSASTPSIAPGGTARFTMRVDAAVLATVGTSDSGVRVLDARFDGDGELAAAAITRVGSAFTARTSLTVVVPFTAPFAGRSTASGVLDAATLTELTAPGGAWTTELDALRGSDAVIALDPAVIASIRVLGSAAPATATAFLAALAALPNEFLELPYGDTDVALTGAAGAAVLPKAASFAGVLDAAHFRAAAPTPAPSPSPSPTATATSAVLPSTATILDWRWADTGIAWPDPRTLRNADVGFLRSSGYGTVLLGSGDLHDTAARVAAGPSARLGRSRALVADDTVSGLLVQAAAAPSGAAADRALASLTALLAVDGASGTGPALLADVPRTGVDPAALGRVLRSLSDRSWIRSASITTLRTAAATARVHLRQGSSGPAKTAAARALIDAERRGGELLAAASGSGALASTQRLTLLDLLSNAWRGSSSAWNAAAAPVGRRLAATAGAVTLAPHKNGINYLADHSKPPFTVRNALAYPVTVRLRGSTSNGRLIVDGSTTATIPPRASGTVTLPMHSISNGEVTLTTTLETPHGQVIGRSEAIVVHVNRGWEAIGAAVVGVGFAALFLIGVYRNVIRPRRRTARPRGAHR